MALDRLSFTTLALLREQADLALADRHISEGEERVAQQAARIVRMVEQGQDTALARDLLGTLEDVLRQWREHRRLILEAIGRYAASMPGSAS